MAKKVTREELEKRGKELEKEPAKSKQAEAQMIHATDQWERVFDAVPDLIMVLDKGYRIVCADEAMADRLVCTPKEIVGLTCYEAIHGTEKPPDFCPHARLLADGLEHSAEVSADRLKGYFLVSVTPLHNRDGTIWSIHVARDITVHKRAEEALLKTERELSITNRVAEIFLTTSDHIKPMGTSWTSFWGSSAAKDCYFSESCRRTSTTFPNTERLIMCAFP